MTSYGAFVEIENDIDGMIHVSDMSWTRKINNPNEVLKPGMEVEAVILDINPEQQRISLGLKQAESDPWASINDLYKVGDVVKGKVTKIAAFGAFVELSNKIDGLIHISQLSRDHVEKVKDVLNVGDEVEARVIKVDTDERRIGLSIKAGRRKLLRRGPEGGRRGIHRRAEAGRSHGRHGRSLQQRVPRGPQARLSVKSPRKTGRTKVRPVFFISFPRGSGPAGHRFCKNFICYSFENDLHFIRGMAILKGTSQ